MGIAWRQQVGEGGVEIGGGLLQLGYLGRKRRVVRREFACRLQIVLCCLEFGVRGHDRRELGEALAHAARGSGVIVQGRVGELRLQARMLGENVVDRGRLGAAHDLFLLEKSCDRRLMASTG